jgi:phosphoribosylformylglycinamidine synthase
MQQTCGPLQLPLNNVAVMALDFTSNLGVATAIGHAPAAALINPAAGSQLAIAEALLNLVWAPLTYGLKGVSLSANWMWPAKTAGESARLYTAVAAVSEFAQALGINIPTGKDSLSMTQKYPGGNSVDSPGTVIISAVAEVSDVRKCVSPALQPLAGTLLLLLDFSSDQPQLGGSSFAQALGALGATTPTIKDSNYFVKAFDTLQLLIRDSQVLAGHDISSGGLITTILEMCFSVPDTGLSIRMPADTDIIKFFFAENPGVVIQVKNENVVAAVLGSAGIRYKLLGSVINESGVSINDTRLDILALRDVWFTPSYLLDRIQRPRGHADVRRKNLGKQPLYYKWPQHFDGRFTTVGVDAKRRASTGVRAAIIREKGVNGDREMAYALYLAGFDVKDVHMTDLVSGREDLSEVNVIVFVGGFSNSDVLGSAKGWAGAFLYNVKAKAALEKFYGRTDTLSLGVCNGCQLMMELGLVYRAWKDHPKMKHNGSGKFESSFINLTIPPSNSIMLSSLVGSRLGAWVAHGEGKFEMQDDPNKYQIAVCYSYESYPGNPNDSDRSIAALCSHDGRHLAIMPHIERSLFPWNWGYYPADRKNDEISPWIEAFVNAREWVKQKKSS